MKKNIIILTILISNICISQIKFGSLLYGKVMNKEFVSKGDAKMDAWFTKGIVAANKIDYTLNFNANEAYFFANPKLLDADENYNLAVINGRGILKYYQNKGTKEFRDFNDNKRTGIVILNNEQKYEWTLLNETKIIDNYKCYKATTPLYNFEKKYNDVTITAWYTPEIPISFGPIGYGGLPGLILELQNDMATFYVKKINLALDKEPEIDKLLSPKAVSQETYMQMVMGTLSKEQVDGMREAEEEEAEKKK